MKIVEFRNKYDMVVEFQNEFKNRVQTYYQNFIKGRVRDRFTRNICGVGYVGIGEYTASNYKDSSCKNSKQYKVWYALLERCYKEEIRSKYPAYIGCSVTEEWLNFQNFYKWWDENWYDVGEGRMHIDKDILIKNNKIYGSEYCLFVPQRINMIFMNKERKDDLPTGITRNTSGTYVSHYNGTRYGTYKTLDEAVSEYEKQKRKHIKQVADEYGDKLPIKVYNALINY
jgi:hypothetical protein